MWNKLLKFELEKLGFMAGDADNMVFSQYGTSKSIEIARWYIDDGLLAADSPKSMDQMIHDIRGSFDIQDLGEPERLFWNPVKTLVLRYNTSISTCTVNEDRSL